MKQAGGPRGLVGAQSSRAGRRTVMLTKLVGTAIGVVTLTTVWAALRSRFDCWAGAQHVQQSDAH